jgi:hypothetical protein
MNESAVFLQPKKQSFNFTSFYISYVLEINNIHQDAKTCAPNTKFLIIRTILEHIKPEFSTKSNNLCNAIRKKKHDEFMNKHNIPPIDVQKIKTIACKAIYYFEVDLRKMHTQRTIKHVVFEW